MKKRVYNILSFVACCLALGLSTGSCIDYEDVTEPLSLTVQLKMPDEFTQGTDFEGHEILLKLNGTTLTAVTDANGVAQFKDIIPDVYDLSTTWEISEADYEKLTGEKVKGQGCTVSGSLNAQLVAENGMVLVLPTFVAVKRDIVIGKIASAGSKDINNRTYMAGKYMELYNQSTDSVDISGLYIGLLDSTSPQPFTLDNLHELYADSVVVVKQVFRIPAGSKPVAPGQAVILTNSATDHSDVDSLEYDLRSADFEAKDSTGRTMNNPETPALISVYSSSGGTNATLNLVQGGPCGVIIFRTDEAISSWKTTYAYGKTSGTIIYLLVPKRVILDGVDYLKNKATGIDISTKRLHSDIDAGYTNINAYNGWTGEVVYRRTAKVLPSGQKVLMDTNNSSEDFKVSTTIKPREYDEK